MKSDRRYLGYLVHGARCREADGRRRAGPRRALGTTHPPPSRAWRDAAVTATDRPRCPAGRRRSPGRPRPGRASTGATSTAGVVPGPAVAGGAGPLAAGALDAVVTAGALVPVPAAAAGASTAALEGGTVPADPADRLSRPHPASSRSPTATTMLFRTSILLLGRRRLPHHPVACPACVGWPLGRCDESMRRTPRGVWGWGSQTPHMLSLIHI